MVLWCYCFSWYLCFYGLWFYGSWFNVFLWFYDLWFMVFVVLWFSGLCFLVFWFYYFLMFFCWFMFYGFMVLLLFMVFYGFMVFWFYVFLVLWYGMVWYGKVWYGGYIHVKKNELHKYFFGFLICSPFYVKDIYASYTFFTVLIILLNSIQWTNQPTNWIEVSLIFARYWLVCYASRRLTFHILEQNFVLQLFFIIYFCHFCFLHQKIKHFFVFFFKNTNFPKVKSKILKNQKFQKS